MNELTMQNYADERGAISSGIIKKNEEARYADDVAAIKLPLTSILCIMSCYAIHDITVEYAGRNTNTMWWMVQEERDDRKRKKQNVLHGGSIE